MLKDGFYVTNRGRTLIAGLMAGDTFAISKVMVGSGRPETLTALAEMTDLWRRPPPPNPCARGTQWN